MAENDKLLEEIKAILGSFKDIGQYTKDLQSTLSNMMRPMQQMSDHMKAVAAASEATAKAQKESISAQAETAMHMQATADSMKERNRLGEDERSIKKDILTKRSAEKDLDNELKQIHVEDARMSQEKRKEADLQKQAAEATLGFWKGMHHTMSEYYDDLVKVGYKLDENGKLQKEAGLAAMAQRAAAQTVTYGSGLMTGNNNPANAIAGIGNSINSLAMTGGGVGGLIGMIIYGVGQDEHFRSVGEKAGQAFDNVGTHTAALSGVLGGAARTLSKWGQAAEGDLEAVSVTMAHLGITAKEAAEPIEGVAGLAGKNLVIGLLAADKAFEMAAGSMGNFAGAMARDFNMSAMDAYTTVVNLGTAAGDAELDITSLMQASMQAGSALRLLNANGESVGKTIAGLTAGMREQGFGKQFSQQYSQAGMQSVTGAVAGMSTGMSGVIGERLGLGSGLDAWYSMKSPKAEGRGGEKMDIGAIMGEMKNIVGGMSGKRSEQAFALTQLMGVDVPGADAILDAMKEQSETGKLSSASQKKIETAFMTEGQKADRMLQLVEVIKDAIAKVSVGLLILIVNSLKGINDVLMWGFNALSAFFEKDPNKKAALEQRAGIYQDLAGLDWDHMKTGAGRVMEGGKQLASAVGGEYDLFKGEALGGGVREGKLNNALGLSSKYMSLLDKPTGMSAADQATQDFLKSHPGVEQTVTDGENWFKVNITQVFNSNKNHK